MKLNNKGFTLVELLTVMVILITILLIAIPSITASLSRSEEKQLDAIKKSIVATVNINIKKKNFASREAYNEFEAGNCVLTYSQYINYISEDIIGDKNKSKFENTCVKYKNGKLEFEENNCSHGCELK